MCDLITLKKDYSIKVSSNITNYLNPGHLFYPINENAKVLVKYLSEVKKEQPIIENADKSLIVCSVSGKVVGIKDCLIYNGTTKKCLVVENDFKERFFKRTATRRSLANLTKEQMLKILESKKIKAKTDPNLFLNELLNIQNVKKIIINTLEDEPYLVNKEFLFKTKNQEIIEIIDFLAKTLGVDQTIIAFKDIERDNIEICNNLLGAFPNIEINLVPDYYLLARNDFLLNYLKCDKNTTLIINLDDLSTIYNILKRNHYLTEKLITITGSKVKNPQVIRLKIGSLLSNVVEQYIDLEKSGDCLVNGIMNGLKLDYHNLIVTDNLEGLIFQKISKNKTIECIRCGKCSAICPVNINPQYLMNRPSKLPAKECIDCGLCSYICPAYIDLRSKMRGEEND